MAVHGDFSPEARERAARTVGAAAVFEEHAEIIVARLPDVPDGHVLVVVVDETHSFAGAHHVEQSELVVRVPELEGDGGWGMVFSPGAEVGDVSRRASAMADIARQRMELIDRIRARRST